MVLFIVSEGRTVCFSQGGQILIFSTLKARSIDHFLGRHQWVNSEFRLSLGDSNGEISLQYCLYPL